MPLWPDLLRCGIAPPVLPNSRHRRGGCFLPSSCERVAAEEAVQLLHFACRIVRLVERFEPRQFGLDETRLGHLDFALCDSGWPQYFSEMNVEELKAEAAKLPPRDRFALAEWIERNEDIRELRHAALVREIEVGLDELDRGECVECKDDAELRGFFDGVKARGRELLGARKNSAA